ncbi:MAG: Holliday junction branch migration protein RuvA [Epsilonproteobacteria bacterium]|nr:Holliday junction branch migration protein RuvA [Campylobacterota bacterium]
MFDQINGKIVAVGQKNATVMTGGIGFALTIPQTGHLVLGQEAQIFTYFHWSSENGPSIFGFSSELERSTFQLIITCPKIGPGIAIGILGQLSAAQFLQAVASQNEAALSALNGIGKKKAEQIVVTLKDKVHDLISKGISEGDDQHQENFVMWQQLSDVLSSLNYSRQEISHAVKYLSSKHKGQQPSLDQLIRNALSYLSASKHTNV